MDEPPELDHALRHLLQARSAIERDYPCEARAHLREAQADLRWALKPVTAACAEHSQVSYLREGERCTAMTAAGTRCMGRRREGTDLCFIHTASRATAARRG
jgi:hypothetical protein